MNFRIIKYNTQANRFNDIFRRNVTIRVEGFCLTQQNLSTLNKSIGSFYRGSAQFDLSNKVVKQESVVAYKINTIEKNDDESLTIQFSIMNTKSGKVLQNYLIQAKQLQFYFVIMTNGSNVIYKGSHFIGCV